MSIFFNKIWDYNIIALSLHSQNNATSSKMEAMELIKIESHLILPFLLIHIVQLHHFLFPQSFIEKDEFIHLHMSVVAKLVMLALLPTLYFHTFCIFLLYLLQLMLVNVKLEIKGRMGITFQGYTIHWTS